MHSWLLLGYQARHFHIPFIYGSLGKDGADWEDWRVYCENTRLDVRNPLVVFV